MQEEHAANDANPAFDQNAGATEQKREISTIQFPYGDLDDAVSFAKAVHAVGGQSCLAEQVAGYLKSAPAGGAFKARITYARIFGLLESDKGILRLTQLGLRIVDPAQEEAAKVDAFLCVPLYKAIYEKYKGYTLPPPAALEREMAGLGVSSKQTDKARQVFDRSARAAGFFWAGTERLTLPVVKSRPETMPVEDIKSIGVGVQSNGGGGGPHDGGIDLDPLLIELLKKIPRAGEEWPGSQRVRWFRTFAMNVSQIYDDDDSPIDLSIGLAKDKE